MSPTPGVAPALAPVSPRARAAGAGVRLAQEAVRALAAEEREKVLAIVNSADPAAITWAFCTVVQALEESMAARVGGDARKTRRLLNSAAGAMSLDVIRTQAAVLHQEQAADVSPPQRT